MNRFERKVTVRVLGIHLGVIGLLIVQSGLKGCFHPKPKPQIVTIIEFGSPAPAVDVQEVARISEPEPVTPIRAPKQEPTVVPEPVKQPVELPTPTKRPVKQTPVKVDPPKQPEPPKWTPTKVDPSKSRRIEPTPVKPTVSTEEIRKALSGISTPSSAPGNPSQFSAYDSQIYAIFYGAWKQPATAAGRPANVGISIDANGRITRRRLVQGSGDASFDQTAMAAVNSISVLPKPPAGYPLNDIVIQFRLVD